VTGVQTCALPISHRPWSVLDARRGWSGRTQREQPVSGPRIAGPSVHDDRGGADRVWSWPVHAGPHASKRRHL